MLIFCGNSNKKLAQKIAQSFGLSLGELEIVTFPDSENRVRVVEEVVGQDCVLIQSTGIHPNLYYMELFFIIDSLKRSGAKSITLVMPYMGYQRQDHIFRSGEAVSLDVIIKILENLGVDKFISLDLHSVKIPQLFKIPMVQLSALELFAGEIKKMNLDDLVLASPDMGGIGRIEKLSKFLGGVEYISIVKNRDLNTGVVESASVNGKVKKNVVIVDDVISTGNTLVKAAELLEKNGAENIFVMATHGIFSDKASHILQNSNIKKVIVSDSLETPEDRRFTKLSFVSISKLISDEIRNK